MLDVPAPTPLVDKDGHLVLPREVERKVELLREQRRVEAHLGVAAVALAAQGVLVLVRIAAADHSRVAELRVQARRVGSGLEKVECVDHVRRLREERVVKVVQLRRPASG